MIPRSDSFHWDLLTCNLNYKISINPINERVRSIKVSLRLCLSCWAHSFIAVSMENSYYQLQSLCKILLFHAVTGMLFRLFLYSFC